jgi:hypothetical protein
MFNDQTIQVPPSIALCPWCGGCVTTIKDEIGGEYSAICTNPEAHIIDKNLTAEVNDWIKRRKKGALLTHGIKFPAPPRSDRLSYELLPPPAGSGLLMHEELAPKPTNPFTVAKGIVTCPVCQGHLKATLDMYGVNHQLECEADPAHEITDEAREAFSKHITELRKNILELF